MKSALIGLLYVAYPVLSWFTAMRLARPTLRSRLPSYDSLDPIVTVILFIAVFFGGFLIMGAAALATGRPLITVQHAALVVLAMFLASFARHPGIASSHREQPPRKLERDALEQLSWRAKAAVIAACIAYFGCAALLLVGYPRGFEVAAYHLPIGVNIFRDGTLHVWDRAFMHAYPANMGLWAGFFLQILPERLVALVNLPFLWFVAYLVYRLALRLGADHSSSALLGAGITSVPIFGFSALELGSDLAGVACVLAAVTILLSRAIPSSYAAVVAGIAVGLAFGFKSLHLAAAGILGAAILGGWLPKQQSDSRWRVRAWNATWFSAGFLITAGVWLLRNFVEFHNPLYPVHLGATFDALGWHGPTDFPFADRFKTQYEWVRRPAEWFVYPWVEWHFIQQNFKAHAGLGAFFAVTVPVAWVIFTACAIARCTSRGVRSNIRVVDTSAYCAVVWSLGTAVLAIWALLGDRQPRYAMGGIALLVPLYGPILQQATGAWRKFGETLLLLTQIGMLLIIGLKFGVPQASYLIGSKLPSRAVFYEYPASIDNLGGGAVILNLSERVWNYPLYGAHHDNRVIPFTEGQRLFNAGSNWRLVGKALLELGISHVFIMGPVTAVSGGCLSLTLEDTFDENVFNHERLAEPRNLYRVQGTCPNDTLFIQQSVKGDSAERMH